MRRASLLVLVAALVAVAGWSSIAALSAPAAAGPDAGAPVESVAPLVPTVSPPDGHPGDGAAPPHVVARSVVIGGSAVVVVLEAAAPVARLVVSRTHVLVGLAMALLAALLAVVGPGTEWAPVHRARRVLRPVPLVATAPRRGPPLGLRPAPAR